MGMLFPKNFQAPKRSKLENVTIRGFGGGWNAVDDDLSMQPRFLKVLRNFRRTTSASQKIRFGTDWFANIAAVVTGNIVDMDYFNNRIVAVTDTGQIATITDVGVIAVIWNSSIAAALPGTPAGWSSGLTVIDFVPFKSTFVIHNGIDKPISIDSAFHVTYLQDLASGSNVNVPIGKFGCTASNYHCVAGIPANLTEIFISAAGTSGTFVGDPDPNDSISIDVGAYAPEGAAEIRGIAGFRNFLIVFFQGESLVVQLGVYDSTGRHTPQFPDTLPHFGLVSHRSIITLENDLVFGGLTGVFSAKRNLFSGQINSAPLSALVDPAFVGELDTLTNTQQSVNCFAVLDRISHDILLFTANGRVFVYTSNEQLRYKSWSEFNYGATNWTCGCSSLLGRVFLAKGTKIFKMGNTAFAGEHFTADRTNDRDANWAVATTYSTLGQKVRDTVTNQSFVLAVSHTSPGTGTFLDSRTAHPELWTLYTGEAIAFEMELPWLDGRDPMKTKHNRFARVGTRGSATFTLKIYVDELYKDYDGNVIYDPAVEIEFIGNQAFGFGYDEGPYGGGRLSNAPRLYGMPVKFQMMKPVITGSSRLPLEIANMSFLFAKGRYSR